MSPLPPRRARARCRAHHGELLQGAFTVGPGGRRRGVVTLPHTSLGSEAEYIPGPASLRIVPGSRRKAGAAAELCLAHLGVPVTGEVRLRSRVPIGRGLGSSTADVTATIRAVAAGHHTTVPEHVTARIAVAAEQASDPIMFSRPCLFDPDAGDVLAFLPAPLPRLTVLGVDLDPDGPGIDTVTASRGDDDATDHQTYDELWRLLETAVRAADPAAVAAVATRSAELNQRRCPLPGFDDLRELAAHHHGLGVQVAHTGTVAGILFDPSRQSELRRARHALTRAFARPTQVFGIGGRAVEGATLSSPGDPARTARPG